MMDDRRAACVVLLSAAMTAMFLVMLSLTASPAQSNAAPADAVKQVGPATNDATVPWSNPDADFSARVNATLRLYPGASSPCNTTLQACISGSADGDTITISPGTYVTNSLSITRAVSLIGGGANPSAVKLRPTSGRMIEYNAPSLTAAAVISNLTVENGNVGPSSGGGIRVVSGSGAPLFHSIVVSNNVADGGGGIRILPAVPVTMVNVTVFSNTSTTDGGGILANGSLRLIDSTISRNTATVSGGGISVSLGITIQGSSAASKTTVSNNSAGVNGGGLFVVRNVRLVGELLFTSNQALGGEGGAIYAFTLTDDFPNTTSMKWTSNSSSGNGGAIRALGDVNFCPGGPSFTNNSAGGGTTADGGAIYADGKIFLCNGRGSSPYSTGNTARNGGAFYAKQQVILNVHDVGANQALLDGGCAYSEGEVRFNSADATGCKAGRDGGAAFAVLTATMTGNGVGLLSANTAVVRGGALFGGQLVDIREATIISNGAGGLGGAAYSERDLSLVASTIQSNTAASLGGAVAVSRTGSLSGTLFATNRVTATNGIGGAVWVTGTLNITNSTFLSNTAPTASGSGGAVAGPVTVTGSVFQGNSAANGGGIATTSGLVVNSVFTGNVSSLRAGGGISATSVTVRDSRFFSNTFTGFTNSDEKGGGAIYANFATVERSHFEGNVTHEEGAAIYISKTASISESLFVRNYDLFNQGSAVFIKGQGGGATSVFSSTFDDNFDDNPVDGGGALHSKATLLITGGEFRDNRGWSGGAILANHATISGATFLNNQAVCCGGGGAVRGFSSLTLQSSTFISNYADCCDGGGAVFGDGSVTVSGSRFFSNTVENRMDGGAIVAQGFLFVDSSEFVGNRVLRAASNNTGRGGAIFLDFGSAGASIQDSRFTANTANHGGAIVCLGRCEIQSSAFENNIADKPDTITFANIGTGGAILAKSDLVLKRSRLLRNSAGFAGGAVYQDLQTPVLILDSEFENNLFAGNSANNTLGIGQGQAVYLAGTILSGKFVFNTLVGAIPAQGSALTIVTGTISLLDNIFTQYATGIERLGGTVFENFNLFFNVATSTTGGVTSGGSSISGGDPKFVDPATDNYRLGFGSAALDQGTDVLVTVDFENDARPLGAGFDIGYDESLPLAPTATPTPTPQPTATPQPTVGPQSGAGAVFVPVAVRQFDGW